MLKNSLLLILILVAFGCGKKVDFIPKAKGYPRIDLPKHSYSAIQEKHPFIFEMANEAVLLKDTYAKAGDHWVIIKYPKLNATIQLTYYPLNNDLKKLQGIVNDAYKLTSKHQIRAYSIDEKIYTAPNGTRATVLNITGNVPSQMQFFTTDTTKNYLRGAIYLQTATDNDSLAPVIDYLKTDCLHLINTLKWRK